MAWAFRGSSLGFRLPEGGIGQHNGDGRRGRPVNVGEPCQSCTVGSPYRD